MRGLARTIASAALAVMLALGCIALATSIAPATSITATVAYADEGTNGNTNANEAGTDTGSITITASAGNEDVKYYAYKIFKCDVELKPGSSGKYIATGIDWPSAEMGTTVNQAIHTYDNTYPESGATAQDAADYIEYTIYGTNADTRVGANGFAENLAKAIDDVKKPAPIELTAGAKANIAEGYYLIITKPNSLSDGQMGTAPIYTMLGNGQDLKITEKTTVPTIAKVVTEDSAAGEQRSYADAQVGQAVDFTLTSTMPDCIDTFTEYYCKIEDDLPTGMDLVCASGSFNASDVAVQIALGATPTLYDVNPASFDASYADHKLTVEFSDLKVAKDSAGNNISLDPTAKVLVSYQAALNGSATVGAPGNVNTVALTYSNNPQDIETKGHSESAGTGTGTGTSADTSVPDQATVYTYQLNMYKYDKDDLVSGTKTPLSGAKFTIQATGADDEASQNKYVQADGSLGTSAYKFKTDDAGLISVKGLDAGTYTISETDAPSGHAKIASDLSLSIAPSFWASGDADLGGNAVGSLKSVTATLTGGNGDSDYTKVDDALTANGIVTIQVSNTTEPVDPPFTGVLPFADSPYAMLALLAGGAILAISVASIVRRRRKAQT